MKKPRRGVKERSSFGWTLAIRILVLYYGYIAGPVIGVALYAGERLGIHSGFLRIGAQGADNAEDALRRKAPSFPVPPSYACKRLGRRWRADRHLV
jgi:hypothetical protein